MVYALIVLAMFLVIGPVIWLRPSKQERELAAMREKALLAGIKIHPINIRKDSFYADTLARNPHLGDYSWVRYSRVAKDNEKSPDLREKWVQRKNREGQLLWEPTQVSSKAEGRLSDMLQQWGDAQDIGKLAIEFGPRSVSIVWHERGGQPAAQAVVEQLLSFFEPK